MILQTGACQACSRLRAHLNTRAHTANSTVLKALCTAAMKLLLYYRSTVGARQYPGRLRTLTRSVDTR